MKLVKRLIALAVILVLLVVIGLVALLWNVDRVAEEAIEYGVPYAMGVSGDAETVSLSLLGGELSVTKLKIGNPEGFNAPFLMNADELDVDVKVMSLWEDTVIVPLIEIKDLTLHIEEKDDKTTNVSVVLENLEKFGAPEDAPPPPEDAAPGKSYRVDRVVIRNIVAHVTPAGLAGAAGPIEVVVPEIVMENVTPDNANGVAVAELTRRLMPAIIAAVVNKAGSALPDALAGALKDDVAKLAADIGADATKLIDQVGGEVGQTINRAAEDLTKTIGGELGENVGKAVESIGKDAGKNLGGALEGFLGGKKKQE